MHIPHTHKHTLVLKSFVPSKINIWNITHNGKFKTILFFVTIYISSCIDTQASSQLQNIFFNANINVLRDWKIESLPYNYNTSNLYMYINGGADLFLTYGFISLTGTTYNHQLNKTETITVDIYDMGSRLNACGIFEKKKSKSLFSVSVGAESCAGNDYIIFYKDRFYVEIQAICKPGSLKTILAHFSLYVAEQLPVNNAPQTK